MYDFLDKLFPNVDKEIKRLFTRYKSIVKFDELNALSNKTRELYLSLEEVNVRFYLKIAQEAYDRAFKQGWELKGETRNYENYKSDLTKTWLLLNVFAVHNPVTEYVYKNEVDRKRARFYEMLVATQKVLLSIKKAMQLWRQQTKEYAITVVDTATLQGFKDAGITHVIRKAVKDGSTCATCAELNGKVYPIDKIPSKTHYNCRCYYVPYIEK